MVHLAAALVSPRSLCTVSHLSIQVLFLVAWRFGLEAFAGLPASDKLKFEQGESPALSLAGTQRSPSLCGVATFPALMLGAGPTS